MTDLNKKILEAIRENDDGTIELDAEDANIFKLMAASLKGAFRGVVLISIIFMFVFVGLAIYCGYQMLETEDVGEKIEWAVGVILAFIVFGILRLWFFLELNRLSLLREIKRVELQVALMAESDRQGTN